MQITAESTPQRIRLPLFLSPVRAGFPSPADDFIEIPIDLNDHLIQHPAATFCVRAQGDSMEGAGIFPGSILIVDRSLTPMSGNVVVAVIDGEFTVKRLHRRPGRLALLPENPRYAPIEISSAMDFEVWGVVVHAIRTFS